MDTSAALTELLELSTQIVEAVVTTPDGKVEGERTAGDERSSLLAETGSELLAEAAGIRSTPVERVHVDLERGSLVVVRDGAHTVVATTVPEPTAGLVAHDLRTVLRRIGGDGR